MAASVCMLQVHSVSQHVLHMNRSVSALWLRPTGYIVAVDLALGPGARMSGLLEVCEVWEVCLQRQGQDVGEVHKVSYLL